MTAILRSILVTSAIFLGMVSFAAPSPPLLAAPTRLWDGFSTPVGMAFDATGNL